MKEKTYFPPTETERLRRKEISGSLLDAKAISMREEDQREKEREREGDRARLKDSRDKRETETKERQRQKTDRSKTDRLGKVLFYSPFASENSI